METVFLSLTKNDFQNLIAETVNECLKSNNKPTTPKEPDEVWFNVAELCKYLPDRPAKSTIYGKVSKKVIPYYKDAKKLSFLKAEIDQWSKRGRKKTISEIEAETDLYLLKTKKTR